MSFRSTALLFGLLLGMLWIFGLMVAYKKTAYDERAVLGSLPSNQDVDWDSLTIQRQEKGKAKEFHFVHAKEQWTLKTERTSLRLDNFAVNKVIEEMRKAQKDENADVTNDLAYHGLDQPQTIVTIKGRVGLKKDKEKEWQFRIGKESEDKTLVYVNSSDWPTKVFAVPKASVQGLMIDNVNHLRPRQLFEFSDAFVKNVLLKEGKKVLEIKKEDELWRFVQPPLGFAESEASPASKDPKGPKELPHETKAETGGVKGLISSIRGMRVGSEDDFVPPTDTNLAEFGLEEGKENLRIQVSEEKKEETLLVGKKAAKQNQYFARLANDPGIFKLEAKELEPIRKALENPGKLRSMDVIPVDTKKVDLVKVVIGKETIQLKQKDEKTWEVEADGQKPIKASEEAVKAFLEAVQGKQKIQRFLEDTDAEAKKLTAEPDSGKVLLFTGSQEKKDEKKKDLPTKDESKKDEAKKDEAKKDEKKQDDKNEQKPVVALTFGNGDKDGVPVKRVLQDGTTSLFVLPRELADKILPNNGILAFRDTALPSFAEEDVTSLTVERAKDKIEIQRGTGEKAQRWIFKETTASQEPTFASTEKVNELLKKLGDLRAKKWLHKIDAKADLDKFGLKTPALTATLTVKKSRVTPEGAASILGFLATPTEARILLAGGALLANREADKGETVVLRFGKEADQDKDKKEKPGIFAQHSGSDLLFLVDAGIIKTLKTADLRDRTMLLATQGILNSGALASGPVNMLASLPLLTRTVQTFDPAKVKEVKLEIRTTAELRKFHFVREKDKTWQDQSGLLEFQLNSDKVNSFLEKEMNKLQAERIVAIGSGAKAEYKFGPKEYTLKMDLTLEEGRTITLTVGDAFEREDYFAQTSDWPGVVFLISSSTVDPLLRGAAYFAKERVAGGP